MVPFNFSPPPHSSSSSSRSTNTHWRLSSLVATALLLSLAPLLVVLTIAWLKQPTYSPLSSLPSSSPSNGGAIALGPTIDTTSPTAITELIPVSASSNHLASKAKRRDKLEGLELRLARTRSAVWSIKVANHTSVIPPNAGYIPRAPAYRNPRAFSRSYQEMEKYFRVYIYEEGEPPLFHDGPCKSTYSTEGRFIYNMETNTRFRTNDPKKAHVYFLPFSVSKMVKFQRKGFDMSEMRATVRDYMHVIRERHPFWNRSLGADHFMISCHDWGPKATAAYPELFENSIRVLCNANTSEGFNPAKDVPLPEMNLRTDKTADMIGGSTLSDRPYLAFFAGRLHGYIRSILLKQWVGKDEDVRVYQRLPAGVSYYSMMNSSKYCICPSGFEVASPRIVEAIYLECIPVIISDHYVLPFSDVLNWEAFSVQVTVAKIPDLKNTLMSIPSSRYESMRSMVKVVKRHFAIRTPPQRFDMFHMVLHSVWLRRLNMRILGPATD